MLFTAVFSFFSCDFLFYHDYPTSLNATDGEEEIHVSWNPPNFEEGEEKIVSYYDVYRDGGWYDTTSGNTYYDDDDSGIVHTYYVTAHFGDGTDSTSSNSDSGYAVRATELLVGDGPSGYPILASAESTGVWFAFLAQGGWPYTIDHDGSGFNLIKEGTQYPSSVATFGPGVQTWTATSTGTWWIRVEAVTDATVAVWHH